MAFDQYNKLTPFEYRILQEVHGERELTVWGSAVGAALSYLSGTGLITSTFDGVLTDKGKEALAYGPEERTDFEAGPTISFTYTNHRGETRQRTIHPFGIEYLKTPGYGYEPGWFVRGFDPEKKAVRSFALINIHTNDQSLFLRW